MTDIERAQQIACKIIRDYGEGSEHEHMAAVRGNLWHDHPLQQSALAAIQSERERAKVLVEGLTVAVKKLQNFKAPPAVVSSAIDALSAYGDRP